MRRRVLVSAVGLGVLLALVIAAPVLAWLYRAPFTVTETNGTAYTQLAVGATINNKYLAAQGYITSTARDTRIGSETSMTYPIMVSDAKTWTATVLPANGQVNLFYFTGEPAADMDIVLGNGGYFTVKDAAALEPGNNFEQEFSGDLSASSWEPISKVSAYHESYSSGTLTAGIKGGPPTVSSKSINNNASGTNHVVNMPAGIVSGDLLLACVEVNTNPSVDVNINWPGGWTELIEGFGAGGYVNYAVGYRTADGTEGASITVTSSGAGDSVVGAYRIAAGTWTGTPEQASASAAGTANTADPPNLAPSWGSWNNLWVAVGWQQRNDNTQSLSSYPAGYGSNQQNSNNYANMAMASKAATAASDNPGTFSYGVNGYWAATTIAVKGDGDLVAASVTGAGGDHVYKASADATWLALQIDGDTSWDGVHSARTALAGASVPDNANNWVLTPSPWWDYYKMTVGGTLIAHFAPNNIVHGTTYSTGTVTVTNGDATVTGAGGAAWTADMDGSIFVSADGVWYVVSSVTSGTTLELTTTYGGGTLGGQTYNMYPRLPDREGTANDGEITWGSNPAGTAAVVSSFVPFSSGSSGTTDGTVPGDLAPPITAPGTIDQTPDIPGILAANPLRPIAQMLSASGSMTESEAWIILSAAFVLACTVGAAKVVRGHHVITGVACGAAIGLCIALSTLNYWFIFAAIAAVVVGAYADRKPSF